MKNRENNSNQNKKLIRGRPIENIIIPVQDTAERVATSIMQSSPKKLWNYKKKK